MSRKNLNIKKYLITFLTSIVILVCLGWIAFNWLINNIMSVKFIEPQDHVFMINKAQQAYYLEYNRFTNNLADLGIYTYHDPPLAKIRDKYFFVIEVDKIRAIVKATPKIEGLKSYIGVVFVSKTADYQTISKVCESNKPLKVALQIPLLVGGKIMCPPNSTEINITIK
jgi:type IV pilus assembly protein PilA